MSVKHQLSTVKDLVLEYAGNDGYYAFQDIENFINRYEKLEPVKKQMVRLILQDQISSEEFEHLYEIIKCSWIKTKQTS